MSRQVTDSKTLGPESVAVSPGAASSVFLRFRPFELEPASAELRRAGVRVHLQAQPSKLLIILAQRPGQVVSRAEIRRLLWGPDTHVDWEQGIHYAVRQVRRALGDSARSPRFLETIPGRGYRFVAPVERVKVGMPSGAAITAPARRRVGRRSLGLLMVMAAVLVGLLLATVSDRTGPVVEAASGVRPRVAVSPFRVVAGESQATRMALTIGLTEDLLTELTRDDGGRQLDVIAPTSVLTREASFAGQTPVRSGPSHRVTGTIEGRGEHVRLTVRLAEESTGRQLWANTYQRALIQPVASLREELVHAIALALRLELSAPAPGRASDAAARRFVRGHELLAHLRESVPLAAREPLRIEAVQALGQGLAADPSHAPGHLDLALALLMAKSPTESLPAARAHLRRALALDESLSRAHLELGFLQLVQDVDLAAAERSLRRAERLDPDLARAQNLLAAIDSLTGRHSEALRRARRTLALRPLSEDYATDACWFAYYAGHYADAVTEARQALALTPRRPEPAYMCWILGELLQARPEAALEPARALMQAYGATESECAALGAVDPESALARFAHWRLRLTDRDPGRYPIALGWRAGLHLLQQDREAALTALARAVAEPVDLSVLFLTLDPWLGQLSNDPQMQSLKAIVEARKAGTGTGKGQYQT